MAFNEDLAATLRWAHIAFGIMWVGLLYFFNFIQWRILKDLQDATKKDLAPKMLHHNLLWFRMAALGTWVFGALLLWDVWDNEGYENRFRTILIGAWLGTFMFLNVWGIIWRYQKKNLAALNAAATSGTPVPPEAKTWVRRATIASRTNVVLSFFMLYFMVASTHFPNLLGKLGG